MNKAAGTIDRQVILVYSVFLPLRDRYTSSLLFRAVHEKPLAVCLLELLLASLTRAATKDQLGPELPLEGNIPVLSSLLVDNWVVVLEVSTEALGLKRNPQSVLMHGVGVLRPIAEVVGIEGERFAEVLDRLGVFVAEDLDVLCQCLVELLGDEGAQNVGVGSMHGGAMSKLRVARAPRHAQETSSNAFSTERDGVKLTVPYAPLKPLSFCSV
jgi:hypothetical protein